MERHSANFGRVEGFGGLEFLSASTQTHYYPRHWHSTFVVEVVERGVNGVYCEGREYFAPEGSIILINPGEVHTGYPAGGQLLEYRSIYPKPERLSELNRGQMPFFPDTVIQDHKLAAKLSKLHQALNLKNAHTGDMLVETFSELIKGYSIATRAGEKTNGQRHSMQHVTQWMEAHYTERLTLRQLASFAGLSPFHFLRSFHRSIGLPPFEFLTNLRVQRARELLRAGLPIVKVAVETGFYDQSHLTRHFRKIVGIAPGSYQQHRTR
jgi:AraC-like DNA-binding protein